MWFVGGIFFSNIIRHAFTTTQLLECLIWQGRQYLGASKPTYYFERLTACLVNILHTSFIFFSKHVMESLRIRYVLLIIINNFNIALTSHYGTNAAAASVIVVTQN